MERTIAALKVYDEGKAAREARWENARTNEDVFAAEKADQEATLTVQVAFHHDTLINSFDNCKLVDVNRIRYAATGRPSRNSVHIGNVFFGRLTGGTTRNGDPEWENTGHCGEERVALLQAVRDCEPLPEGYILVGNVGGPWVPIPSDAVHWASSGVEPSVVTKRYKVKVTRKGKTGESAPMLLGDARELGRREAPTAKVVTILREDQGRWFLHQIIK
jgi:hypothetical protein